MAITHVQLLSIPVSDQDRAKDFYVNKLGFKLITDMTTGPDRWLQVAPEGAETSITLVTWFPTMAPGSTKGLVLETDDLDENVERLRERSVDLASGIEDEPWGRYINLNDPDGNGIILQATRK